MEKNGVGYVSKEVDSLIEKKTLPITRGTPRGFEVFWWDPSFI